MSRELPQLEPWPFVLPIAQGLFTVNPLPNSTTAKVVTSHTKIRHLANVLSPSSVLKSEQLPSRVPSGSSPSLERPGFSVDFAPVDVGRLGRNAGASELCLDSILGSSPSGIATCHTT